MLALSTMTRTRVLLPALIALTSISAGRAQLLQSQNGTSEPIWGLSTQILQGQSPLCGKTFADANATGNIYFNPNVVQGPQAGQPDNHSGKTLRSALAVTIVNGGFDNEGSSNSSAYSIWYDTNGANYTNDYLLGYDVCALAGFNLNYNTQLRGQNDNGSCLQALDQPCVSAIQSYVAQWATWLTTPSSPSNLTNTTLPTVCRTMANQLSKNMPQACSPFFDPNSDGIGYALTSYGDSPQRGLSPDCTLNGTYQNTLSFYNNNSQAIYGAWVDTITPLIGVWLPIADSAAQQTITNTVVDLACARITDIRADSYHPPAEPAPTPIASSSSTSTGGISGGAIAGIVIAVLALLAIAAAIAFFLVRRRRRRRQQDGLDGRPRGMSELSATGLRYEMSGEKARVEMPVGAPHSRQASGLRAADWKDSHELEAMSPHEMDAVETAKPVELSAHSGLS